MAIHGSHNVLQHLKPHTHVANQASAIGTRTVQELASLVRRQTSTNTCAAGDSSGTCLKSADSGNMGTIIIALAAGIPVCGAIVVLYFLHRRLRRKQRAEDANDPHKSLDFGLGDVDMTKSRKRKPEMSVMDMEKSARAEVRGRGMSFDMGNPYLLPAAVQDSRGSLHSMSRTLSDSDDPYRPVTFIKSEASSRHASKVRGDNASTYTDNSGRSGENSRLLANASRMSRPEHEMQDPSLPRLDFSRGNPPRNASLAPSPNRADRWYPKDDNRYGPEYTPDLSAAAPATPQDLLSNSPPPMPFPVALQRPQQPETHGFEDRRALMSDNSDSRRPQDALRITVPSPTHNRQSPPRSPAALSQPPQPPQHAVPFVSEPQEDHAADYFGTDIYANEEYASDAHRLSIVPGLRPLPPDDPTDNPEQRANRIRSFYKEYFDDSKPNPPGHYPQYDPYGDDYRAELLDEGAIYDPDTGAFINAQRPYADPVGRRAMTPPPRAPGSFHMGHRSAASTQSAGRRAPAPPKKQLPPPKALQSLPTPHLLRDETLSTIEFAPPTTHRDRLLGRGPDSPTGVSRPYSPAYKPHTPLAQSFDDLAAIPSPHLLRKSGAFTGLDFAPPPRFKGMGDNASDAGSIKSNRSGISAMQRDAIRAGAYRVSRLPRDYVGSRDDLAVSLKPTWDMRKQ